MIQLYHVYKKYPEDITALSDITFKVEKGDFAFLTGPSGAGKTTLLRLLFFEEKPTSGQILIDGRNLTKLPKSRIPYFRRNIGFIFQDFKLIAEWTVYDNISFVLEVLGVAKKEIRKRVIRVLGMVGLQNKIAKKIQTLSGGEQQRVAIARAIVKEPKILLADEPTGNLDPDMACEIMELFYEINVRGTTVIVATHNMALIKRYGGRLISLKYGRLAA